MSQKVRSESISPISIDKSTIIMPLMQTNENKSKQILTCSCLNAFSEFDKQYKNIFT